MLTRRMYRVFLRMLNPLFPSSWSKSLTNLSSNLPNIEFSCRPESDRYAPVRRTALFLNMPRTGGQLQRSVTSPTDDGGAASHCTKPRITSNPFDPVGTLGLAYWHTYYHFPLFPIQFSTHPQQPKTAVPPGCTPAIKQTSPSLTRLLRPATTPHIPKSVLQSGAA